METIQAQINEQQQLKESYIEATQKVRDTLQHLVALCQRQHLSMNPQATVGSDPNTVIFNIKTDIRAILEKIRIKEEMEEAKNASISLRTVSTNYQKFIAM